VIWVILAAVGVPVRVREAHAKHWRRGHAIWVHDVLAFRGSPAAWKEKPGGVAKARPAR
jgi:hypothetical protein